MPSVDALEEFSGSAGSVRLPPQRDVPLSARVIRLIDHPVFQRLRRVRQLGPISLIYPGATHTRFEHSLGVYGLVLEYLRALLRDPNSAHLTTEDLEACMLAGLLHDLGHYPFAHSLEAAHAGGIRPPRHEVLAEDLLFGRVALQGVQGPSLAQEIERSFSVSPEEVLALVSQKAHSHATPGRRLVASIVSSGMDADKSDYLERDALHMGLSFGAQFDRPRLLSALRVHPLGDRLALSLSGRMAAESFVFARYGMFSEGYWHHTARAVSAMVEEALREDQARFAWEGAEMKAQLLRQEDEGFLESVLARSTEGGSAYALLSSLSYGHRVLHRRVLTLTRAYADVRLQTAYDRLFDLSLAERESFRRALRNLMADWVQLPVQSHELLIDVPPRDKDRVEEIELVDHGRAYPLSESSQIVRGISADFVKVVKKIRIFVSPQLREALAGIFSETELQQRLVDAIMAHTPSSGAQQRLL